MTQTFKLYRLQQLDSQLDTYRKRVEEIDQKLKDNKALRAAELKARNSGIKLDDIKKTLKSAEQSVKEQLLKIEQTEATLYGGSVRNPKELQDLQNEAIALKRYLDVLEERQLDAMLYEEEAQEEYRSASQELETVTSKSTLENKGLTEEKDALLKDIARLEDERQTVANSIPAEDLQLYENLRAMRRGIAVARVSDNSCSACGSTLSAALLYQAKSPSTVTRCDSCGRILYVG